MNNSVEELIGKIFEMDANDLTDEHSPGNIEQWDSMNHLKLVTAIEDEYKIKLTMREIQSMLSVKDIKDMLNKYSS